MGSQIHAPLDRAIKIQADDILKVKILLQQVCRSAEAGVFSLMC
jgi:hypothetical protein